MNKYLCIITYECFINDSKTNSLDTQVKCIESKSIESAKLEVGKLPIHKYKNLNQENVEWRFKEILAIEEFNNFEHGKELIGFIKDKSNF